MSYYIDYHIHSRHSTDAVSSIREICLWAMNSGLKEIAVTDHFEPSKGDEFYKAYDQKSYWAEITKEKQEFKGRLEVKLGVELGQPHLFREGSQGIMKEFPYDYVLGSAHKLESGIDMSEIDYGSISIDDVCSMYLKQLEELLDFENFDCVGHMDLIKRYSAGVYGKNLTLACQYELLTQVFRKLIQAGKGIEINTSGLRQAPKETMPGLDVLKIYRTMGGEILTTGSDSHRAEDVGKGISAAYQLAELAGFDYVTAFSQRKPEQIAINPKKHFQPVMTRI
jgi:histidinol-phosphatase (PHP family)